MTTDRLALALQKQRLQIKSTALREQWFAHVDGLRPALQGVDRLGDGWRWARQHPETLTAAGIALTVALLVARPRALWRWSKRGLIVWQAWRRGQDWLGQRLPKH